MECQKKTYIIISIISSIILIIAYAFIMCQSIINIIFSENNYNHIIVERFVYEQFSHEVYSNIESKMLTHIQNSNDTTTYSDYDVISIPIKLESFYDCEDTNYDEIDKDICQNKITSTSLCCRNQCCIKQINEKKETKYCSNKNSIYEYEGGNSYE